MILAFTAAWESSELSETFMACIDAGRDALKDNDQQFADRLGVAYSRITAMRQGLDAGPGILRFASLPLAFWVACFKEWGVRFCIRVVTDHEIDRLIGWMNFHMVSTMKRDAAKKYPGQGFDESPTFTLPLEEEERSA